MSEPANESSAPRTTTIEVRKPGLSTTIQDGGRSGYYHLGIPPSGALDQYSLAAANGLVGNGAGAAALEIVYMGPELAFTGPAVVAVTGAGIAPRVNGSEHPLWESFEVAEGDVLDCVVADATRNSDPIPAAATLSLITMLSVPAHTAGMVRPRAARSSPINARARRRCGP